MLIFYKIARQNLYATDPSSHSSILSLTISMTCLTIWLPCRVKYSTPGGVHATTDINEQIACFSPTDSIYISSIKNCVFYSCLIRKISFFINSFTKLCLCSGEIYRAFTLRESNTSIMLSTCPSCFARIILFLWSCKTASENSWEFESVFNSVNKILWYFPKSTL